MWEIVRILEEMNNLPSYVLLEIVITVTADDQYGIMLRLLSRLNYDCAWGSSATEDCGAIHERQRWFLLAKRRIPEANTQFESRV